MKDIILIGPVGVGKSTIGKLLSIRLGIPLVSLDEIRWEYFKEIGYSRIKQNIISTLCGLKGVYKYWKKFEAYAVKRALESYSNCIFDFGAGHSVYEKDKHFNQVKGLLMPYKNIFLLLPCEDVTCSLKILDEREKCVLNKHFLTHPSNRELSKYIIYTYGKTEDDICNEIIDKVM